MIPPTEWEAWRWVRCKAYAFQLMLRACLAEALAKTRSLSVVILGPTWLVDHLGLPPRPGAMTKRVSARWLERILNDHHHWQGLHGGHLCHTICVASVELRPLDENRGLDADVVRVIPSYTSKGQDAEGLGPVSLILKTTQSGFAGRHGSIAAGKHREAMFYNSGLLASSSFGLPTVYYAYGSELMGEAVILMEDITAPRRGHTVVGANLVFGNQVWGGPEPPIGCDPVDVLRAMFLRAAGYHAAHWRSPSLLDAQWLKGSKWYAGKGRAEWESAVLWGHRAWSAAKEKERGATDLNFSARLVAVIDRSFEAAEWSKLQAHLQNPSVPWTLCHGDFHASNCLLVVETPDADMHPAAIRKDAVIMFDWSEVGPWEPATDLAQTVISDVKPELMRDHVKVVVREYWERLRALGVPVGGSYSWEVCWEAFCRGGMERWIWLFAALASMPLPHRAIQYYHDQLFAFLSLIDHHRDGDGEGVPLYVLKPVVCLTSW